MFWKKNNEESSNEDKLKNAFSSFREGVRSIWPGGGLKGDEIDDLETALLQSDVSFDTVEKLLAPLREGSVSENPRTYLRSKLIEIFQEAGDSDLNENAASTTVYFFIGVNGSGKTTSMAKLAHSSEGNIIFAAADTFRAAAIDQLGKWSDRLGVTLIAHEKGGDPTAVVFDALDAAISREADYLFVDTAGRLHTRGDLMAQLEKMYRVTENKLSGAPNESFLVLDASTGQNGLRQVKTFARKLPVSGIILTKMDSTARGGIVLSVAEELKIPVKLVGTGEKIDDLVPFDPEVYCDSLLGAEK